MASAAKGLANIMMLDDRMKVDLLKIAPKILLLTYDYSKQVSDVMKELWSCIVDVDQEKQVIDGRWEEIYDEAFKSLMSNEFRKKQSGCLALCELMANKSWKDIEKHFKEIFLNGLGLLEHQKDSVKTSAY